MARGLIAQFLQAGPGRPLLLNLNIPDLSRGQPKGLRVCRMDIELAGEGLLRREDPRGRPYFWMTSKFGTHNSATLDNDRAALAEGYVTLTPLQYDLTNVAEMKAVATWPLRLGE